VLGKGPQFVRVAFNIYGRSPLLSQYLASMNADVCKRVSFLVERTELENLPPYPVLLVEISVFDHFHACNVLFILQNYFVIVKPSACSDVGLLVLNARSQFSKIGILSFITLPKLWTLSYLAFSSGTAVLPLLMMLSVGPRL